MTYHEKETRSPITGLLILAVPILIGVLLVVFRDNIFTQKSPPAAQCDVEKQREWLLDCAKYSDVNECRYKSEILFCKK